MWLSKDQFRTIIAHTPLVSIDLVVQNERGQILLGERRNRPAQGYWFVPGGRVLKNETLMDAFNRLTVAELGAPIGKNMATFLGVYEHFYDEDAFDTSSSGRTTHYVVLAYHIRMASSELTQLPIGQQHSDFVWWDTTDLVLSADVHDNSKAYIARLPTFEQRTST